MIYDILQGLGMAVIKLALPGFRHSVEWWGLPTRLEWASAPDRGVEVTKLGPRLDAWPSGVCVGLGCRNFVLFGGPAAKRHRPCPWGDSSGAS